MDALPPGLDPRLAQRARDGAAWVRERAAQGQPVLVVHHIDADGVSAGAIAATALERAGVTHRTLAVKSMDQVHQDLVRDTADVVAQAGTRRVAVAGGGGSAEAVALWFCDLGSTVYMQFPGHARLVCDHHQLVRDGSEESFPHVNPLLDGLSGEEVSGAGCAYLVAAALDARNIDLLPLALVGASGDLQDRKAGRFQGTNTLLAELGHRQGGVSLRRDVAFFGPETRPLRKFLAMAEPAVPTATGSQRTAEAFLLALGIAPDDDAGERTWARLSAEEQRRVRTALVDRLVATGMADRADRLWRTVVTFPGQGPGPTREAQEFATLLNGTARYGRPEVGLAVARGDRGTAYQEALGLLLDHRKHLASALDAFAKRGVTERLAVQHLHLHDAVLDTVVGIVCGMALDGLGLRRDLALVAFAWTPDGRTKVSSRSPHELQARGVDLATAMREAAALFGGQGGGHAGAAGATIPRGAEEAFIVHVDAVVARQLGVRAIEVGAHASSAGAPAPTAVAANGPTAEAVVPFVRGKGPQARLAV